MEYLENHTLNKKIKEDDPENFVEIFKLYPEWRRTRIIKKILKEPIKKNIFAALKNNGMIENENHIKTILEKKYILNESEKYGLLNKFITKRIPDIEKTYVGRNFLMLDDYADYAYSIQKYGRLNFDKSIEKINTKILNTITMFIMFDKNTADTKYMHYVNNLIKNTVKIKKREKEKLTLTMYNRLKKKTTDENTLRILKQFPNIFDVDILKKIKTEEPKIEEEENKENKEEKDVGEYVLQMIKNKKVNKRFLTKIILDKKNQDIKENFYNALVNIKSKKYKNDILKILVDTIEIYANCGNINDCNKNIMGILEEIEKVKPGNEKRLLKLFMKKTKIFYKLIQNKMLDVLKKIAEQGFFKSDMTYSIKFRYYTSSRFYFKPLTFEQVKDLIDKDNLEFMKFLIENKFIQGDCIKMNILVYSIVNDINNIQKYLIDNENFKKLHTDYFFYPFFRQITRNEDNLIKVYEKLKETRFTEKDMWIEKAILGNYFRLFKIIESDCEKIGHIIKTYYKKRVPLYNGINDCTVSQDFFDYLCNKKYLSVNRILTTISTDNFLQFNRWCGCMKNVVKYCKKYNKKIKQKTAQRKYSVELGKILYANCEIIKNYEEMDFKFIFDYMTQRNEPFKVIELIEKMPKKIQDKIIETAKNPELWPTIKTFFGRDFFSKTDNLSAKIQFMELLKFDILSKKEILEFVLPSNKRGRYCLPIDRHITPEIFSNFIDKYEIPEKTVEDVFHENIHVFIKRMDLIKILKYKYAESIKENKINLKVKYEDIIKCSYRDDIKILVDILNSEGYKITSEDLSKKIITEEGWTRGHYTRDSKKTYEIYLSTIELLKMCDYEISLKAHEQLMFTTNLYFSHIWKIMDTKGKYLESEEYKKFMVNGVLQTDYDEIKRTEEQMYKFIKENNINQNLDMNMNNGGINGNEFEIFDDDFDDEFDERETKKTIDIDNIDDIDKILIEEQNCLIKNN